MHKHLFSLSLVLMSLAFMLTNKAEPIVPTPFSATTQSAEGHAVYIVIFSTPKIKHAESFHRRILAKVVGSTYLGYDIKKILIFVLLCFMENHTAECNLGKILTRDDKKQTVLIQFIIEQGLERNEWKNHWQAQVADLKKKGVKKESNNKVSWGAQMHQKRFESDGKD
ncbi:hypothetical protein IFM89_037068 [Coptis chinensis]|uniref:Uncharacterized protein n=1 Tax=Coptis chinensis TaxID=261450 RepID=A0A835HQD9_9MAGN|nr:hypothetical protein IFM89_037068 [Coptis chinensis]